MLSPARTTNAPAVVAEVPLAFPMYDGGVLLWREQSNRPLLRRLHGLARVAHWERRWNCAEMTLMRLLYLDPVDEQQAGVLLREVRAAAGIAQPDKTA
ncbi:hypothetical protein [Streptomyces marianii]|uniref:Uncharacterized protein n=1 Tax=Streptomyces marianii TaxID=1817406 RepID=A0A5R9DS56_9ACTN|nr:hypothetical protein [Streptomyces marianii]TLQ39440.1 hypothetical protein FEF34_39385 [Streptomyces marianii]